MASHLVTAPLNQLGQGNDAQRPDLQTRLRIDLAIEIGSARRRDQISEAVAVLVVDVGDSGTSE